ncbi:hypothetical protein J6590_019804 [Homalodisca vitripennis]|nr:hypothetical protein J6590_019804 [Homalodisca vitripennis]
MGTRSRLEPSEMPGADGTCHVVTRARCGVSTTQLWHRQRALCLSAAAQRMAFGSWLAFFCLYRPVYRGLTAGVDSHRLHL